MAESSGSDESIDTSSTGSTSSTPSIASPESPNATQTDNNQATAIPNEITSIDQDDADSSDASMSADSDDSDDEDAGVILQAAAQPDSPQVSAVANTPIQGLKRKLSMSTDTSDQVVRSERYEYHKKMRTDDGLKTFWTREGCLEPDRSLLPAEIWHHIFTFVPPRSLGRLLRVNKGFNAYLDPSSSQKPPLIASLSRSAVSIRQPDSIWQASRKLYRPKIPAPLEGMSELGMWRLACSTTCQFCGKVSPAGTSSNSGDPWHSGPGTSGVHPVWLFQYRSCGSCLIEQSLKEIDLLLSSSVPSPLMAAVPFLFFTNEQHIVTTTTLSQGQQPADIQIVKLYPKAGIEEIKQEFFAVKALGVGAAEEWLKGLEDRGRRKRDDARRWERWESNGGLPRMRVDEIEELTEVISRSRNPAISVVSNTSTPIQGTPLNGSSTPVSIPHTTSTTLPAYTPNFVSQIPHQGPPQVNGPPSLVQFGAYQSRSFPGIQRQERTREEVTELKAARKAEIERRCMLLDPPITPGVLGHMASFQAALQIIKPFDDNAWDLLKPRLLSQRGEAEQREAERVEHNRVIQAQVALRQQQDAQIKQESAAKESRDGIDNEHEKAQEPVRNVLSGYADELIEHEWMAGSKVNFVNSPKFAADVLLYVRKRFHEDIVQQKRGVIAMSGQINENAPDESFARKLTLENMKWVFDTKVKPFTEPFRKELFLCGACDASKMYGFEGVVQHYAAKHTGALSNGSIVVHWRAEWPEEPPFNPEPLSDKTFDGLSNTNTPFNGNGRNIPIKTDYGPYTAAPPATLPSSQMPITYPQSNPAYYGPPHYPEQYGANQVASHQSITPMQAAPHGYQDSQYPLPQGGYPGYQNQPPGYQPLGYQPPGHETQYPETNHPDYDALNSGPNYPSNGSDVYGASYQNNQTPNQGYQQPNHPPVQPIGTVRTEEYRARLLEMAQAASYAWKNTSGVKEMAGSVRVYVILFYIVNDFRAKYDEDPPLTMIIDGLSNNKDMRPVRNINGLACRACKLEENYQINNHRHSKGSKVQEKKLFSFPQLLNHFQAIHITGIEGPPQYDWTIDMVELPEKKKIISLSRASGMDEEKLKLVKDALPESFIESPPPEEPIVQSMPHQDYGDREQEYRHDELPPSVDKHDNYYKPSTNNQRASPVDGYHVQPTPRRPISRLDNGSDIEQGMSASVAFQSTPYQRPSDPMSTGRRPRYLDEPGNVYENGGYEGLPQKPQSRDYSDENYLEGPRYYSSAANLSELLANPALHGQPAQTRSNDDPVSAGGTLSAGAPLNEAAFPTASSAAEKFLDEFQPEPATAPNHRNDRPSTIRPPPAWAVDDTIEHRSAQPSRNAPPPAWLTEHEMAESHNGPPSAGSRSRGRELVYEDDYPPARRPSELNRQSSAYNGRELYEAPQRQIIYEYDDRYPPRPSSNRPRQEPMDYQYESEEVIYVDEHGRRVAPPAQRYSRLDAPPIGSLRPRSRGPPMYMDEPPARYRDQDSDIQYVQNEAVYRGPQAPLDDVQYERAPRQEYYRVYADEPPSRRPRYEDEVQYVSADDPRGEYIIRRPNRKPAPAYARYDDREDRQVVYERPPPPRLEPEPVFEDEEYDPRNPAPPPITTARQVRYQ